MSKRVAWKVASPTPSGGTVVRSRSRTRVVELAAVVALALSSSWLFLQLCQRKVQPQDTAPLTLTGSACSPEQKPRLAALSRAALAAPWNSRPAPFNSSARIPMQLWQTSRSSHLGPRAQRLQKTWLDKNPGVQLTLMNDTEASAFIRGFYGSAVAAIFEAFPVGVMRADFWRYAVLYARGGVYADTDTECLRPMKQWFPPQVHPGKSSDKGGKGSGGSLSWQLAQGVKGAAAAVPTGSQDHPAGVRYSNLTWDDCSLVVALENEVHMCQWVIAAAPGHPLVRAALQASLRSVQQGMLCSYEHMVHAHTGPGTWTSGMREGLGLPGHYSAGDIVRAAWGNATVARRARELRACFVSAEFWGQVPGALPAQNVKNHYSSQWRLQAGSADSSTPSWTQEAEQLVAQWRRAGGRS